MVLVDSHGYVGGYEDNKGMLITKDRKALSLDPQSLSKITIRKDLSFFEALQGYILPLKKVNTF